MNGDLPPLRSYSFMTWSLDTGLIVRLIYLHTKYCRNFSSSLLRYSWIWFREFIYLEKPALCNVSERWSLQNNKDCLVIFQFIRDAIQFRWAQKPVAAHRLGTERWIGTFEPWGPPHYVFVAWGSPHCFWALRSTALRFLTLRPTTFCFWALTPATFCFCGWGPPYSVFEPWGSLHSVFESWSQLHSVFEYWGPPDFVIESWSPPQYDFE